jgi:RNA 2',3'-cyclic 3'-phosphodiesterase
MEQIRSFIAIELPQEVKAGLRQIQAGFKSGHPASARWVDPEGIHLTLQFLGNVDADKIEAIQQALKQAAIAVPPFHLELKGLGAFPSLRRAQVVWVGLRGDLDKLQVLQKRIETSLLPLGFEPEKRAFTPHLTLARMRDMASPLERQTLGETISRTKIETNLMIEVNSVSLMRSQLTRAGAIYTRLCLAQLNPSCQ